MTRLIDRLGDLWDWIRRLLGFDRMKRERREEALSGRGRLRAILYWGRPILTLVVIAYVFSLIFRLSGIRGDDLDYPQTVFAPGEPVVTAGAPVPEQEDRCRRSDIVDVTAYIITVLVDQNTWAPSDPQFKIGWFGLAGFEAGPFFDNKAAFELGALRAIRRFSIELADILGRTRGTSTIDPNLDAARSQLQRNPRSWYVNVPGGALNLIDTPFTTSLRNAAEQFRAYNDRLERCDAVFDARNDNLFQLLDRVANEVGSMQDELATRSQGSRWDPRSKAFIDASGNNAGVFDFYADNLFYEAHGLMWAWHGLMQATKRDFADVVRQANLGSVWDRMESNIAETARLDPIIVSNGREDSLFTPDHLAAMSVNMLRARANMTELRGILAR